MQYGLFGTFDNEDEAYDHWKDEQMESEEWKR